MKNLLLTIFIFGSIASLFAQPTEQLSVNIDAFLTKMQQKNGLNGVVLVSAEWEPIYKKAFGYADPITKRPLKINSPFYLGSIAKQFTTMGIMLLKEQGKLNYDNSLSQYFPQFPEYATKVTIRHLMTHTSGIKDHFNLGIYKKGLTNQDVFNALIVNELNFKPGEKYQYSNGAYVLLAMIIEKVSGQKLPDFMNHRIFKPLGMKDSYVVHPKTKHSKNRAIGFSTKEKMKEESMGNDYEIFTTGAGGIYSTVEDLLKWDKALFSNDLIAEKTLAEAFQPTQLNDGTISDYGFGWGIIKKGARGNVIGHTGSLNGFRNFIEIDVTNTITLIALTNNTATYRNQLREGLRKIREEYLYQLKNPPSDLKWRNIGPANMMGRIAAVEALDNDYRTVLCASASGGVFLSKNAGITWESIFDNYGAGSIGSVAFFQPKPTIIWVGTGESANRNSSGWGDGIYKSNDGGKTFENMGLESTHQIAEIATHPMDSNIVYAAAIGHLWGYSGERGLFKTTDGGNNWVKLTNGLPNDGKTGCTEIIMHPENPDILFAGFYQRLRKPYHFQSGGANGGLFKSTDGGKSWRKITKGLAGGDTGMIDVAIHRANPDIMVMAYETDENSTDTLKNTGVYRSDDGGESWKFLLKHAVRPFYHGQIDIDPIDPNNIYVVSRAAMNSTDGGKTFHPRRWRADGGDDHDMWISPTDNKVIYLATDQGLRLSTDGGKTFLSFNNMAIGQYYAIGVDMRDPYWVIGGLQDNGIWIGPSNSREWRGVLNEHNSFLGNGDGFHAQIDPTDYRTMYYVNHVGFAVCTNFETREYHYITPTPETIVNFSDYADPDFEEELTRYTIYPGEHWFFYDFSERPKLPAQFRFNWSSPLVLSPKNPRTLYFGGNHLFKSIDRGNSWRIISPDLTGNDPARRNPTNSGHLTRSVTGGESHFTIITIAESPVNESVIWIGTDDGKVQITRNGGISWTDVKPNIPGLPDEIWVSRVESSHFKAGTCYVTFDNHRYDDNKPYVFKTTDFGKIWTNISANLPSKYSVYVIKEDPVNPNLLFAGTEAAVHVSINGGKKWERLMQNMPTVAIHDLVIHPREGDLIAGTHGRSIWILDDISPLRQLTEEIQQKDLHLFKNKKATKWKQIDTGRKQPFFEFRGQNPTYGAPINFYVKNPTVADTALIEISEFMGNRKASLKVPVIKGINRTYWNFQFPSTAQEKTAYHQHLNWVIKELEQQVKRPELIDTLALIKKDWEVAKTDKDLNKVRRKLVKQYAVYANGQVFFGKKIGASIAEVGAYKVTVFLDGKEESGVIEVRDDPIVGDW